jgi:hypothetical protein
MTTLNSDPKMRQSMSETDSEPADKSHMAIRLVVLLVPVPLTARLLTLWLPTSIATAGSLFIWMMLIYWLPWKANMSLRKWLLIVCASSIAAFFAGLALPGWH